MQSAVVHRQVRRLAQHFLSLHLAPIMRRNSRADRAAIRLDASELDLDPVMATGYVIAQQRRRLILIDDEHVQIPVVIEIAESAAAAGMSRRDARSHFVDQFLELSLAEVAE